MKQLRERIRPLAKQGIYLGTSSWKYPGWKGLVYEHPYPSEKAFNENCLEEYAETFSTVGIDHTYYAWPNPSTFAKYLQQTPNDFRFGLKVTDALTVLRYPKIKRFGSRAGQENADFLSPKVFLDSFIEPLVPFRERIGPVMLEFSEFHPGSFPSGRDFVEHLDRFFGEVQRELSGTFCLAVEMRNRKWLQPLYFETLSKHGVSHVFNSWTRMPTLSEQLELARPYDLPMVVSRVLLQPGTKYAEAVEAFSPYDALIETGPELRSGTADLIRFGLENRKPSYLFVNNRAEGCAPLTIQGVLDLLPLTSKSPASD